MQSHQQQAHSQQQTIQQQQQQQQQDNSGNRPKRYSSLRQRPTISETSAQQNYPSQHAQHGYFPPQGNTMHASTFYIDVVSYILILFQVYYIAHIKIV